MSRSRLISLIVLKASLDFIQKNLWLLSSPVVAPPSKDHCTTLLGVFLFLTIQITLQTYGPMPNFV